MDREGVYGLIDGERDHQDDIALENPYGADHTVGDFIVMLQHYTQKATTAWVKNFGDAAALEIIRECAGICVRCMEEHDTPSR